MNTAVAIKSKKDIKILKTYFRRQSVRNYLLFIIGINTNLRISDIISLKLKDVLNGEKITEKKTGKTRKIIKNSAIEDALNIYIKRYHPKEDDFLFFSRKIGDNPITRQGVHKILSMARTQCAIVYKISAHSLRKTWGFFAYQSGTKLEYIVVAFNHSSPAVTLRYIGITSHEVEQIFTKLIL
jgi:Site-specific recombinase XerD